VRQETLDQQEVKVPKVLKDHKVLKEEEVL
jgi:hypothetical protein